MAYHQISDPLAAQLDVYNAFELMERITYGEPRRILLSLDYAF